MTAPFFAAPGGQPYRVAPLSVTAPPVNELAADVTMATLPPDLRALALRAKAIRDAQFGSDALRSIPAGIAGAIGHGLTGLASLVAGASLGPPGSGIEAMRGVQDVGDTWTRKLMDWTNARMGATPGTTGTQTGEQLTEGGLNAAAMGAGAASSVLADAPAGLGSLEPSSITTDVTPLHPHHLAPDRILPDFVDVRRAKQDGTYLVPTAAGEPGDYWIVDKQGRALSSPKANVFVRPDGSMVARTVTDDRQEVFHPMDAPPFRYQADDVLRRLGKGGFTLDPRTGEYYSGSGFGVSNPPGAKSVPPITVPTAAHIQEALQQNAALLRKDGMYLGGWRDGTDGQHFLDVTQIVPDQAQAMALARQRGERAIYDFGNGREIRVPPTEAAASPAGLQPGMAAQAGFARIAPSAEEYRLSHWSNKQGLTVLDPARAGTGSLGRGQEQARGMKGVFVYNEGTRGGYEPPFGDPTTQSRYDATGKFKMYDLSKDPLNLIESSTFSTARGDALLRRRLLGEGYDGYYVSQDPYRKGVMGSGPLKQRMVMIRKLPVTETPPSGT